MTAAGTGAGGTVGGEGNVPADLRDVVAEIREEARRKRESGEYPAGLERELDALFEDLVPERLNEHDFDAVLDRAQRASLIDLHAPVDDERFGFSQVKRGVQKLILWYMEHVVRQLSTFAAATTRGVRLLGDRVEALEARLEAVEQRLPETSTDLDALAGPVPLDPRWSDAVVAIFREVEGRVLHGEAGDGALVDRLVESGADAYGVDPRADGERADLRADRVLAHLRRVGDGELGGAVLTGCVDRLPPAAKVTLASELARAVADGGTVALVGLTPDAWERRASRPVVDLAPGRPFHPDTWRVLLDRAGFGHLEVRHSDVVAEGDFMLTGVRVR